MLPWCTDCERADLVPARGRARRASATAIEWRPAAGDGDGVRRRASSTCPGRAATPDDVPYAVALVDLAEGVRMMSNVVGMRSPTT